MGIVSPRAHVLIWPAVMGGLLLVNQGRVTAYLLLMGLTLAYAAGIASLGLAIATWVSRLGRAVTICICVNVVFAIGWPILVMLCSSHDLLGMGLLMGSPLCGTPFATLLVASGDPFDDPSDRGVWLGAFFWLLVHGGAALALFAATVASFDSCLGRMPESGQPGDPRGERKPPSVSKPELDDYPDEDLVAVGEPPQP